MTTKIPQSGIHSLQLAELELNKNIELAEGHEMERVLGPRLVSGKELKLASCSELASVVGSATLLGGKLVPKSELESADLLEVRWVPTWDVTSGREMATDLAKALESTLVLSTAKGLVF